MKVVILSGLDGTGAMLDNFAHNLRASLDVEIIDYPIDVCLTYSELSIYVQKRLPIGEPYTIIAESFSGPVAALVAATKPINLRALIFVASFVRKPIPIPSAALALTKHLPLHHPMAQRLSAPLGFGRWMTETLYTQLSSTLRVVAKDVLGSRLKQVLTVDEVDTLSKTDLPSFYIQPTNDRLVSNRSFQEMRVANPALIKFSVKGPHFILQTKPAESAACIRQILNELPDGPSGQ